MLVCFFVTLFLLYFPDQVHTLQYQRSPPKAVFSATSSSDYMACPSPGPPNRLVRLLSNCRVSSQKPAWLSGLVTRVVWCFLGSGVGEPDRDAMAKIVPHNTGSYAEYGVTATERDSAEGGLGLQILAAKRGNWFVGSHSLAKYYRSCLERTAALMVRQTPSSSLQRVECSNN